MLCFARFFHISFLISLFFFMGCSSKHDSLLDTTRKNLRLCLSTDPIHLDVAKAGDSASGFLLRMVYEGLTRLDKNSKPVPALAEKWTISSDGRTYTFYLRNALWSNGELIKAQDFVASWQYLLDPKTASPNAYQLFPILHAKLIALNQLSASSLGVRAIDDRTLEVRLEEPTPYFLQLVAFDSFYPSLIPTMGTKALEERISCGPFLLKSWKIKNEIHLVANPHYWDRAHVKLENIHLLVIADSQTALHMYESGDIDWIGSPLTPLPSDASEALNKEGILHRYQGSSVYWINCNLEKEFLKNLNVRRALSLSIDRKKLCDNLGFQHEEAHRLVPPLIGKGENPKRIEFNPDLAKEMWQKALEEMSLEKAPELTYIYNASQLHAKVAQMLQSEWKQRLGLDVTLVGLDWAIFLQRARAGDFDLARFGWPAQFSDPVTFLEIFEDLDGAYNFSRFENETYRHLLSQSRHGRPDKRDDFLFQSEKLLLDEGVVIPLFFGSHTYLKRPGLNGVVIGPLGRIDFKLAYWENPHS